MSISRRVQPSARWRKACLLALAMLVFLCGPVLTGGQVAAVTTAGHLGTSGAAGLAAPSYSGDPQGPPVLPGAFWGTVTIAGSTMPAGTPITAWISDALVAQTTTLMDGTASVYSLDIPGDDPDTPEREGGNTGEVVRFKIGPVWAKESGSWESGSVVNLNLTSDGFASPATRWIAAFGYSASGWTSQNQYPRTVADVNADGRADVVGFGGTGVSVSLSSGSDFSTPARWIGSFGVNVGGWTSQDKYPRMMGDVNGDGLSDIVGFGNAGTYVSLSTGSGFGPPKRWIAFFGYSAGGWTSQDKYPRMVGDVNGDGKADVVGFGNAGAYVSLSTGSAFGTSTLWIATFGYSAGGWTSQDRYPRMVADVNGDGKADIVGFAAGGVYVALSKGNGFASPVRWLNNYGVNAGGWTSQDRYPRMLADMNGDGKDDVVGFGVAGPYVALSTGSSFSAPLLWLRDFGASSSAWASQNRNPRCVADVNGDGRADIVGFGNDATYVSLTDSSLTAGSKVQMRAEAAFEESLSTEEIIPDMPQDKVNEVAETAPESEFDYAPWRGEYFANDSLAGEPALVREDQDIDFDWGEGAPDAALPADSFSIRWMCALHFDEGDYIFHALADDGVRLFVDGQPLIDRWVKQETNESTGQVHLTEGKHALTLEFFEAYGDALAKLWWEEVRATDILSGPGPTR